MIVLGVISVIDPSINAWAHGGSFLGGWVIASLMGLGDEQRESPAIWLTALGLIAVTGVGFGLSFFNVTSMERIPDFPVTRSHPLASWPSAANSSICRT